LQYLVSGKQGALNKLDREQWGKLPNYGCCWSSPDNPLGASAYADHRRGPSMGRNGD
jgi:hypothetical protein